MSSAGDRLGCGDEEGRGCDLVFAGVPFPERSGEKKGVLSPERQPLICRRIKVGGEGEDFKQKNAP